jgi:hypothetical protein
MKTISLLFLVAAISGVFFTGCKKIENEYPLPLPKTLNDLKVADSFNWSSGTAVELTITGLPTVVPVKSTLAVGRTDGTVLFTRLHVMSENLTLSLTVPSTDTELILQYGTVTYHVPIQSQMASFSFIPVLTQE